MSVGIDPLTGEMLHNTLQYSIFGDFHSLKSESWGNGYTPYFPKRDEFSQRLRNLIEQTNEPQIPKHLYYSLLYCIISKGHLLLDITEITSNPELSPHGPGFDLQNVLPAFVGLKCSYISCTAETNPGHLTSALFKEHMSASMGKNTARREMAGSGSILSKDPSKRHSHTRSKSVISSSGDSIKPTLTRGKSKGKLEVEDLITRSPKPHNSLERTYTNRANQHNSLERNYTNKNNSLERNYSKATHMMNTSMAERSIRMMNPSQSRPKLTYKQSLRNVGDLDEFDKEAVKVDSPVIKHVRQPSTILNSPRENLRSALEPQRPIASPIIRAKTTSQVSQMFIVDHIEDAPLQTIAALFEIMETNKFRHQSVNYVTPDIFIVIVINRDGGVFSLTEDQLDHFLLKINLKQPLPHLPLEVSSPVISLKELNSLRAAIPGVFLCQDVEQYMRGIISTLRNDPEVESGASPKANFGLKQASRAVALIFGQNFVTPSHVLSVAANVLTHRVRMKEESEESLSAPDVVNLVLNTLIPPL